MDSLDGMRADEGRELAADITSRADKILANIAKVEERAPLVVAEYQARLKERVEKLAAGVEIDGREVAAGVAVKKREEDKTVLELTVWEGRYHLVKRLLEKVGHPVLKLKRLAFGPLRLGRLTRGVYRMLTPEEVAALKEMVGLK